MRTILTLAAVAICLIAVGNIFDNVLAETVGGLLLAGSALSLRGVA